MSENSKHSPDAPTPARFQVSRFTLLADTWMGRLIRFGGVSVVVAVLGMLVFLVCQVLPLFSGAKLESLTPVAFEKTAVGFGEDEYGELPFTCDADGKLEFRHAYSAAGASAGAVVKTWSPTLAPGQKVTTIRTYPRDGLVILGLSDGNILEVKVAYKISFDEKGGRTPQPQIVALPAQPLGKKLLPCLDVWSVKGPNGHMVICRQQEAGRDFLTAVRLTEKGGMGGPVLTAGNAFSVASDIPDLERVFVPSTADSVIVVRKDGEVRVYTIEEEEVSFLQSFKPFASLPDSRIASAGLIFGNVSLVVNSFNGVEEVWSIYPQVQSNGQTQRRWGKIHDCEPLAGAGRGIFPAVGNKCYLTVAGGRMQIRNMTNGSLRWDAPAPAAEIQQVVFSRNYDRLGVLSADGVLRRWSIEDHHPEASWNTFFGKIWYEGASAPAYTWQSSSGADEFEAKYSLVPLLYGTIKGTFYALLFAIPIALLAAVYVSQFLRPELKKIIKPTMEIMASLPSVVLGFLAGIWLAPIVDANLLPLICLVAALAPSALAAGFAWSSLPQPIRRKVGPGWEFAYLIPFVVFCGWLAWQAAPMIESTFFSVKDLASGQTISDFREWWRQNSGWSYDSRNSIVVGFVMGFAVIPIVFTIAEDALSNVPDALVSGSLALGASRWQTVWSVVVPTAISGIVSGIMIGFGRAVGETMIVVMATGNTPVMEANPFNGMRTLSANIAVELPEAAVGQTHYRALFLGACCLFALTFVINTFAEILRQRLRERYKVV